jgi:AcrR family transcriptional regulator
MEAALESIATLGFHSATMDDIVARAGSSRGAQIHHFPTKLDLVEAAMAYMLTRVIDDLREHTSKIRAQQEKPHELFEYLWAQYFSQSLFTVTMEIAVASRSDPLLRARASVIADRFHKDIDDCWYLLCRDSQINDQRLMLVLNLTMSLLRGLGFQAILWNRPDYFKDLLRGWLDITRVYFDSDALPGHTVTLPAKTAKTRKGSSRQVVSSA